MIEKTFSRVCEGSLLKSMLENKVGEVSNEELVFALKQLKANKKCYTNMVKTNVNDLKELATSIKFFRKYNKKASLQTG